jgi:tetratricopeptide (TPR) repeat protein
MHQYPRHHKVRMRFSTEHEGLTELEGSLRDLVELREASPEDHRLIESSATAHTSLAEALELAQRLPDALAHYRKAEPLALALAESDPDSPRKALLLAETIESIGAVHEAMGEIAAAREAYQRVRTAIKARTPSHNNGIRPIYAQLLEVDARAAESLARLSPR